MGHGGKYPVQPTEAQDPLDAPQVDGVELLALPCAERCRRLEALFAVRPPATPWTLCPMTTGPGKAR
ncbi:hypothetical protein [Streptomyces sp. NPDC091027]|uniref:hypothetical protein n=1 Tax=Streptomyces sp. NPDC091027 TaxID=3365971 RepID=UPI00382667AB